MKTEASSSNGLSIANANSGIIVPNRLAGPVPVEPGIAIDASPVVTTGLGALGAATLGACSPATVATETPRVENTPNVNTGLGFKVEQVNNPVKSLNGIQLDQFGTHITAPSLSGGPDYSFTVLYTHEADGSLGSLRFAQFKDSQGTEETVPVFPTVFKGEVNGKKDLQGIIFYTLKDGALSQPDANGKISVKIAENLDKPLYSIFFKQGVTPEAFQAALQAFVSSGKAGAVSEARAFFDKYLDNIAFSNPNAKDAADALQTATVISYAAQDQELTTVLVSLLTGAKPVKAQAPSVELTATAPQVLSTATPETAPTAAPTEAPKVTFEQWAQANQPDSQTVLKAAENYAQVTGADHETINPQLVFLPGPKGEFAVMIDATTSAPLMIALPSESGKSYWVAANRKNLADAAGLGLGTSVTEAYTESWSPESKAIIPILGSEGNKYVIDYEFMWYNKDYPQNSLRPDAQSFNFKMLDAAVTFARKNNLKLEGQYLMQGNSDFLPPWLKAMDNGAMMDALHTHIDTVVKRYPQIKSWVVAGEFENPWGTNFWKDKLGLSDLSKITPESLAPLKQVYDWAHTANPDAKLFYSEGGGFEFGGDRADRTFNMIKMLKDMKTPIDGIAFQMHLKATDMINGDGSVNTQKLDALKAQIARYKAIGVDVIVPEMDLNMHGAPGDEAAHMKLQATIEKAVMKALLQSGVTEISFFGGSDKLNWMQDPKNGGGADAHATIFDADGNRKPSYYADEEAIVEFLQGK